MRCVDGGFGAWSLQLGTRRREGKGTRRDRNTHEVTGDRAGCSAGTWIDMATRCSYRYNYRYRRRIEELDAVFSRLQPGVWLLGGGGSGYLSQHGTTQAQHGMAQMSFSTWHGSDELLAWVS
jgi:hypothetical protein